MNSIMRKIKKNAERKEIKEITGFTPKKSCPYCHKMTLFTMDKEGMPICIRCQRRVDRIK